MSQETRNHDRKCILDQIGILREKKILGSNHNYSDPVLQPSLTNTELYFKSMQIIVRSNILSNTLSNNDHPGLLESSVDSDKNYRARDANV